MFFIQSVCFFIKIEKYIQVKIYLYINSFLLHYYLCYSVVKNFLVLRWNRIKTNCLPFFSTTFASVEIIGKRTLYWNSNILTVFLYFSNCFMSFQCVDEEHLLHIVPFGLSSAPCQCGTVLSASTSTKVSTSPQISSQADRHKLKQDNVPTNTSQLVLE